MALRSSHSSINESFAFAGAVSVTGTVRYVFFDLVVELRVHSHPSESEGGLRQRKMTLKKSSFVLPVNGPSHERFKAARKV